MGRVGICVGLVLWLGACGETAIAPADPVAVETAAAPERHRNIGGVAPTVVPAVPVTEDEDPYGLKTARNDMEATPALRSCASEPDCPEHAEARFFTAMFGLGHVMTEGVGMDDDLLERLNAASDRLEAIQDQITGEAVSGKDFRGIAACIASADDCEGTLIEDLSASGTFDEFRSVMKEVEAANADVMASGLRQMAAIMSEVREAANLGSPSANAMMGVMYGQLDGATELFGDIERNDAIAVDYLIAAADGGSPEGAYHLAQMIHVGRAGPTHDVDQLLRAAHDGGLDGAGHILLMRQRERGQVDTDLEAAVGEISDQAIFVTSRWDLHPDRPETEAAMFETLNRHYARSDDKVTSAAALNRWEWFASQSE